MKIYLISGLGADERVFRLLDFHKTPVTHIHWLEPQSIHETLSHYTERLSEQIDLGQEVVLVGVSFGGIIAQELARVIPCRRVIIISSVKSEKEYPLHLKLLRSTRLYALAPASWLKKLGLPFASYFFGTETSEETVLLRDIIRETPEKFMTWAIWALMRWKNPQPLTNLIHFHGTQDRVFPTYSIRFYIPIEGGGHFMILNRATLISNWINKVIQKAM